MDGLVALLMLLRRSSGSPAEVRSSHGCCSTPADPNSHTVEWDGEGRMSALFDAVERGELELVALLLERGGTSDGDAFYHACEQSPSR